MLNIKIIKNYIQGLKGKIRFHLQKNERLRRDIDKL